MKIVNYFNPFQDFKSFRQFAQNRNIGQRILIVIATIFCTLLSLPLVGLGGVATFRTTVNYFSKKNEREIKKVETSLPAQVNKQKFDLECPEKFKVSYQRVSEKFVSKVLNTPFYTLEEKQLLFEAADKIYKIDLEKPDWVTDYVTMNYLLRLCVKYPHFHIFSSMYPQQFECEEFNFEAIAANLPITLPLFPCLYGHALRVNGNHRTAFMIDFEGKTVEYFNSFGSDIQCKTSLKKIAQKLSDKYEVKFSYIHQTKGIQLQKDSNQCGIWVDKLIEERIKKGKNFNPYDYKDFDIAAYKNQVLKKAFKYNFYNDVGIRKMRQYENSAFQGVPVKAKHQAWSKLNNYVRSHMIFLSLFYCEWGKTGLIPQKLGELYEISDPLFKAYHWKIRFNSI